jgi:hypothetical protein
LYIGNYEKPLKELSEAEENYKKTLGIHRTELLESRELLLTKIHPSKSDTDQIDNIDKDLEDIETMNGIFENKIVECIVNGFISARASLSSMQKRKEITPELNIDRENEAIKELQVTFTIDAILA